MFSLYTDFWKNIFNFGKKASGAQVGVALILNLVILAVIYFIGLVLAPPMMENAFVIGLSILALVMAVGMVSSIIRSFKK